MWHQHAVQAFLIAAVLSPFSYYAGRAANKLKLPQITGYLASGIICGPYVLAILSQDFVRDLSIIEGACLGIIGLAAGAELQLAELNRSKRQVMSITAGICAMTWIFCFWAVKWTASLTPALGSVSSGQLTAVASLGGTLMMTRSPASAIAVLKEMDAKGPFASLVMGVVVLKDVVVIVLFALNMELVPLIIHSGSSDFGVVHMLLPFLSVVVSLAGGLLGGYIISLSLQYQLHAKVASALSATGLAAGVSHAAVLNRCKQVLVLLMSTAVFSIIRSLEAEPLLACVTAGMLLANRRLPGSSESTQDELAGLINSIMALTNVAFFGLAGASLKLAAIADSVWVALVVFLVRLAALASGSWLGCMAGGMKTDKHQQCFWLSMITQAGVAMGLARIAGTKFADWGPAFQTVMMAIIMINMLVGPPCFRSALIQVGEARAHYLPSTGHQSLHRDSFAAADAFSGRSATVHVEQVDKGMISRHPSCKITGKGTWPNGTGSMIPSSSNGPVQGQLTKTMSPTRRSRDAGEDVNDDDGTHHVVVSSGALLNNLTSTKHRDSSG